ncbi:SOS response-associated peptidase [Puniceicoccales bacterium CK1056]|uniref:Abasic site processing protein n=1 Tax=Oceanipulchritudo coccoides TaxID=2706888 RepID=A0A6B2M2U3_9BACT|nr:SOS response-associated peptidase [Oceanipulchritudo coccoides]NDV62020.1 SOS response-associated peptidase [Oceanipulchritudo coccoides]
MCGRYTLSAGHEALAKAFLAEFGEELKASWKSRYNITPGTGIVAIHEDRDRGGRRAEVLHWGLVPSWAKDPNIGYKLINARAETIADKPSYRDAFRYRRCLVPASGFYEWDRRKSPRQPYYFRPVEEDFMAMAGIWEHWMHPSGSEILSVSLITTEANKTVGKIHHRMPVILGVDEWDRWLDTSNVKGEGLSNLLGPASDIFLKSCPVSSRVNKTDVDEASLTKAISLEEKPTGQMDLFGGD